MNLPPVNCQFTSSYSIEQPLLPTVHTNAFTQVPPAKKITFYKSGDPQFAGIKMAINQRSFKSFNALMDDLSHRISLPFGVRTITTPQGIHFISTLDQLEDGGYYLCSDKKYVTPLNAGVANRKLGSQKVRQPASVLKRVVQDIKQEDYSMAFTQQSPRIPKKITLIKNGDITTQLPIILNRRNAQSFKILLDEISEIMQFTVRKLYTIDGKRIDSMQGLLLCPNVLICVGQEPFKPLLMQNPKKYSSEKLPGLASHSNSNTLGKKNEMNFGLKAKKSVIHPRSSLSNRSMRFSLSSEKSYRNGPVTSPENGVSSSNNCAKGEGLVPSLVNDDIEKKVYMNKDGSLAVEMKVCFHLLSDETLQWSTQIKKSSLMNQTLCEESDVMEDNQSEPREKINQETSFEMEDSLYPCDADSYISNLDESENEVTYCHCSSKSHSNYDIWKNPMHASQKEEPGITNTWYTHSSCSSTSSHQRIVHKKTASIESIHASSNERKHSEHIIQETSDSSETLGNKKENDRIKNCCCRDNYMQTSKSQKELSEKMDGVAGLASSENEHGSIVKKERNERRSRARSNKSKCQYSIESQIKVLEETSNVVRTISSCSIKEREEVIGCSSSPNSACSKSSKCGTFGTRDKVEKISDNDHILSYNNISSFSSDDCPPKIATQVEVEKEDEDNNEINSVSEKTVSNCLIKDEVNRWSKRSKIRVFQSKVCNEEDRSDSSEMDIHSAALSASRIFSRSKCNHYDSKGDSKVSSGSSRGSTIKRKRTKGPLHVEDGSSRTTYSSENSNEVGKRDKGSQLSHNSSHSNVSSLSEAAANSEEYSSRISKCYSKSSISSHKRTQREDTEVSSSVSNVLESDEKNGANTAKNSTQENIFRQGSSSESMCSKCGHAAETRNNYLQGASSKNLLHSGVKSTCSEMQASENNDVSSQSSIAQSSKQRQKKRSNTSLKYCNEVSEKVSTTQFNFHSPVPPRGRPSSKNSRSLLMNINSAPASNELEPTADELEKEMAVSPLLEMDTANEAEEKEGSGHEKKQIEEETVAQTEAASETCDQIIPSSLPNASPEEVVHEWLRKIPSESLLMTSEMQKDEETIELHLEIPNCSDIQDSLQEECSEKEDAGEDCEQLSEKDCPQDEKASEIISGEAETNQGECQYSDIPSQNNHKKDLPNTIQISVQIMKVLLASKHETKLERSYSLPEVSPSLGKNLSNSANILIQCLATLQLLDEELDPSNKRHKCLNWFRYKELLNIFQAMWFGNILENGDTNLGLQGKGQIKISSSFKDPNSKDGDSTPMTSSGIDLSSGDGGSGEEIGVGGHDCALLKEKRNKVKFPEEGKPEREDGNEEEPEEHSQPLCSKLESESEAELAGVQEVIEAKEDQDLENNIELEKNSTQDDQNVDDAENVSNEDDILVEAHTDTVAKEVEESPSEEVGNNETEPDSSVSEAVDEKEAKIHSENQSVTKDDTESSNVSHQITVKVSPMIQQRSGSQDPVWVLKLLKKIEKEFMTHYVNAMNEFKVKWNLTNSEELDLMIAELKEEVSRRIQKSVEEELNKIKNRTGKKIPKPPENELRQESTPELENRRRRLTSMLSLNNISDHSTNSNKQLESGDINKDDFFYNTIQEDERYDDQLKNEEYCPCDVCMRKTMVVKTAQHTAEIMAKTPNPVLKAFDLQEILRMKNTSVAHRKTEYDISEAEQEEEAQQAAKETMESDGEEEAKCDEGQEDGQAEQEQEEEQQEQQEGGQEDQEEEEEEEEEEGQEDQEVEQEEEQEEKQEEGQEEEEQEEGQEEKEQEEQEELEEEQEEGQEDQEKEGQVEQEEEQQEQQERGQEDQEEEEEEEEGQEEEQEEEQEEGQEEEEEEEEEGQEEEQEEKQEEGQEEEEQEEEQKEEQEEKQEEGQKEEEQEDGQEEQEQEEQHEEQEEEQEAGQEDQEKEVQEGQEEEQEEEKEEQDKGQEEQEEEQEQKEQPEVEQQDGMKGEGEENEGEEKPNIEDEEKEGESMKEDEKEEAAKQEDEEKSETESVGKKEEEEEKETEEDIILGELKEGKEDEEWEKEVKVEQDEEQGETDVIYEENNQEMEAKSEGAKELNDEEEMDGEQKETSNDDQEAEDEPNATDNSAIEVDEKESQGAEPKENDGESQAIIEEEIPDSSEQKSENNASLEAKSEPCSETAEVEEEDENKEGDEAGENEAEGEDSNEFVQNPGDDRETGENGAPETPEKGSEGIFSQQSQEGSEYRSDEDESKKKENISNEDGDCGSDGESKLVIESKPAKMYPDSNEEEEEDQPSQASIVMEKDPPNEDNEDSHQVSKNKKQNSNIIDQDDLDF